MWINPFYLTGRVNPYRKYANIIPATEIAWIPHMNQMLAREWKN